MEHRQAARPRPRGNDDKELLLYTQAQNTSEGMLGFLKPVDNDDERLALQGLLDSMDQYGNRLARPSAGPAFQ